MVDSAEDDTYAHWNQYDHSVKEVSRDAEEDQLDASIVIAVQTLTPVLIQLCQSVECSG